MTPKTLEDIRRHAESTFPRECCGLVYVLRGRERYAPCHNLARGDQDFVIDPEDFAQVEDLGQILCVVHSHCNIPPAPSQADLVGCESSGLPWLIYSLPTHQTHYFEPSGYRAPLVGRVFSHGVLDCYTLVRDYYAGIGIVLDDFTRDFEWWLNGQSLYLDHYREQGFVVVADELREHDALLMRMASPEPNHAAVYLGGGVILQHITNRLSSRDVYGGYFEKVTTHHLRHESLC